MTISSLKKKKKWIALAMVIAVTLALCIAYGEMKKAIVLAMLGHGAIITLIYFTCKSCHITFTTKEAGGIAIYIAVTLLVYFTLLQGRRFFYFWDYSNYYNIQLSWLNDCKGPATDMIRSLIDSLWYSDYSCFINLFTTIPYILGRQSNDAYIFAIAVNIFPYLIISVAIFIKSMNLELKGGILVLLAVPLLLPLLHRAVLVGQPDAFGLIWIFLIMSVANGYDFKKISIARYILMFVMTIALMITRRWYMFWVVGFYVSYLVWEIVRTIVEDKAQLKKTIGNMAIFGVSCGTVGGIMLFPMLKKILLYDYADRYSFYLDDGIISEIPNQYRYLGLLVVIAIFFGIVLGIKDKLWRYKTLTLVTSWAIALILFTRVQNMSHHQSLILVPAYIGLLVIFAIKIKKYKWSGVMIIGLSVANLLLSYNEIEPLYSNSIISQVDMKVYNRDDYDEVRNVTRWILDNCEKDGEVYIIPHYITYNPDVFRNAFYGEDYDRAHRIIPYGSAVFGTQPFPIYLFTSDYIMTCEPFDETCIYGLSEKYNNSFLAVVDTGAFEVYKRFDMGNNHTFVLYKRVQEVSDKEIEIYTKNFAEENEKYPDMYQSIWDMV